MVQESPETPGTSTSSSQPPSVMSVLSNLAKSTGLANFNLEAINKGLTIIRPDPDNEIDQYEICNQLVWN